MQYDPKTVIGIPSNKVPLYILANSDKHYIRYHDGDYYMVGKENVEDRCFQLYDHMPPSKKVKIGTNKDGDPKYKMVWDIPVIKETFDPRVDLEFFEIPSKIKEERVTFRNFFKPGEMLKGDPKLNDEIPKTINWILDSVFPEEETKNHFLNWLAYIIQTRERPGTSWIFFGGQGSGKSTIANIIISGLVGMDNTYSLNGQNLLEDYNPYMKRAWFVCVEEVAVSKFHAEAVYSKIKNFVTEDFISIREMRKNLYTIPNHSNFIFTSNEFNPMKLGFGDRRFNATQTSSQNLQATEYYKKHFSKDPNLYSVFVNREIKDFMGYLMNFNVNPKSVKVALDNPAKRMLVKSSHTRFEELFEDIRSRNAERLIEMATEQLKHVKQSTIASEMGFNSDKEAIVGCIEDFCADGEKRISIDTAGVLYGLVAKSVDAKKFQDLSPHSISKAFGSHGFSKQRFREGESRNYYFTWK